MWTTLRALLSDDSADARREARETVRQLQAVLPEDAPEELVHTLVSSVRDGHDADGCAHLLGRLGEVIPKDLHGAVVDTFLEVLKIDDPRSAEAVPGLAHLARHVPAHAARVRNGLLDALEKGVLGREPERWERAFAPLRHAPHVMDDAFVVRVLDFARRSDALARLRAAAVLRAVRPGVARASLPACFDRILDLNVDADAGVRDKAEDVLAEFLLSLPLLPEAEQTSILLRVAAAYPRFNSDQRIGMVMDAHTLHETLSNAHKEILLESLLAETNASDPRAAAEALHTAAALVVGSPHDLVNRVVNRTLELGRIGAEPVKGEASEAWGDLMDAVPPEGRMTAVEELARLASEGVRSWCGGPWSILASNRRLVPVEAASVLVPAFLRMASGPEANDGNLVDAARTVGDLVRRLPRAGRALASAEATDAAFKGLLPQADRGDEEHRGHAVEALAVLALLLPSDRSLSIVEELGRLCDTIPTMRNRGAEFDEDEVELLRPAVARALADLLPHVPESARAAIVAALKRLGTGRRPEPEALAGLAVGGTSETTNWALDALVRLAQSRRDEDLRCRAIRALGALSAFPGTRGGEVADVLVDLMDEVAEYVPGSALDALKALFPKVPDRQRVIIVRFVLAVDEDEDPDAAYALADLGAQVPDEMRAQVVEVLRYAYEASAGEEDDWRFARATRDFAMHLPLEDRDWLWSIRMG